MKKTFIQLSGPCAVFVSLLLVPNGWADSHTVVDSRIQAMKEMKRDVKLIADMVRGRQAFNGGELALAARRIASGATHIPGHFPQNSESPESSALPAIWLKPALFERYSVDLEHRALTLAQNAPLNDVRLSKKHFRQLGRACAACHKEFRQKKEEEDET